MAKTRGGMNGSFGRAGVRCRVKLGTREGEVLCYFSVDSKTWVAVVWDGDAAPVCFPWSRLLFKESDDRTFKSKRCS